MTNGSRAKASRSNPGRVLAWLALLAAAHALLTMSAGALSSPPAPWHLDELSRWINDTGAVTAAFALVRLLALVVTWYLAAITVLSIVARAANSHPLTVLTERLTLPFARTILRHALGAGMAVTLMGGMAPTMGTLPARAEPMATTLPGSHIAQSVRLDQDTIAGTRAQARLIDGSAIARALTAGPPTTPPASSPTSSPTTITITPLDEPTSGSTTAPTIPTTASPATTSPTTTPGTTGPTSSTTGPTTPAATEPSTTPPTPPPGPPVVSSPDDSPPDWMAESPPRSDAGIEIIPLPAPTDSSVTSELWTIRPGDHLWRVAEQTLMQVWHRRPTTAEITPYWRAVVELNRSRLAVPDNPDLVFPGQRFILPPPPLDPSPASTTIPDRPADR